MANPVGMLAVKAEISSAWNYATSTVTGLTMAIHPVAMRPIRTVSPALGPLAPVVRIG